MQVDTELDASGLHCPLPLLKAKKALSELASGQLLRVIATDPGSWDDFAAFIEQSDHQLLESRAEGERFVYLLRKG